jgi:peptidyl-tRNA hydrolase, PTH1 family
VFLLVGLGNPGAAYASTRHNVGFMLLEALHRQENLPAWERKFHAETVKTTRWKHPPTLLLKPQTYMNRSGQAVQAAMAFYKIELEHVIVVHDELDLPLGTLRTKTGGGNAGHNGLKSIEAAVGNAFTRVRLGIGRPAHKEQVSDYVLSAFTNDEQAAVETMLADAQRIICEVVMKAQ